MRHATGAILLCISSVGCGGGGGGGNAPAPNDAPVATPRSLTVNQDTSLLVTLSGTDANGDPLTYGLVASPTNGTLTGTPPNITYRPRAGFTGSDSFSFTASDGRATSGVATVNITVLAVGPPSLTLQLHDIDTNVGFSPAIFVADVDGDSDLDVLSADNTVRWHEQGGNGSFVTHAISTSAVRANSVHALDVDSDGDVDLLSAEPGIRWFENNGSEVFTARTIFNGPGTDTSVLAIDLDGDGDIDVLGADSFAVRWFENDGSENFVGRTIVDGGSNILGVEFVSASDLDSDGDIDVLAGYTMNGAVPNVRWYENDGNEVFVQRYVSVGEMSRSSTMRAIDVDGDNDIDVVSAEDTPEQLMWYENNGNEIFGARDIAGAGSGASVAAIDFDNDGDVDVLSSSISDVHGVLALHENNGNQVFGVRILADHAFRSGTVAIHAADLDSDGDVDVVGAWFTEGIVSWFENPTN